MATAVNNTLKVEPRPADKSITAQTVTNLQDHRGRTRLA
jgi:hypothetical protein